MSETTTKARRNDWFEGDVTVNHNLTVGGILRAKRIKQPLLGLFSSGESLASHWPEPVVGMWAVVGTTPPFIIWRCDADGVWTNTGEETEGFDGLELVEVNEAIAELQDRVFDWYDASWLNGESEVTVSQFEALRGAIMSNVPVYYNSQFVYALRRSSTLLRVAYISDGNYSNILDITNSDGVITIENNPITLADIGTSSLANYYLKSDLYKKNEINVLLSQKASLSRVTTLEEWVRLAGNAESLPHYHSANWLEDEEDPSNPGQRQLVHYTSLINAINNRRLIKMSSVTASGVDVGDGWVSLCFVAADSTGATKTVTYIVRHTEGESYCRVEKREVPLAHYHAAWAYYPTASKSDFDALVAAINAQLRITVPASLRFGGYATVVNAQINTPYVVTLVAFTGSQVITHEIVCDTSTEVVTITKTEKSVQFSNLQQ